jgi:alanyl-tRNA synthetase
LQGELERTRKAAAKPKAQAAAEFEIVEEAEAGGRRIVLVEAKSLKGGDLRDLSDRVKQQQKADVVLAGSVDDGRAYVVVNLGPGLPEAGVDAVAIIRELGSHIGGGGGGRPTLAEAGGKNPAGLREALTAGKEAVLAKLA